MANRQLLCPQNIVRFKGYLLSKGYVIHDSVGFYEVLRASHKDRKNPIIVYKRLSSNGGGKLVHYTVADKDVPIVVDFLKKERKFGERMRKRFKELGEKGYVLKFDIDKFYDPEISAYKITEIEYDIEPEDVEDGIDEDDYALNSDFVKACEDKVDEILETLPVEIKVMTTKDFLEESDLQEFLAEEITDRTGWLVKSFKYEKE